MAVEQLTEAIDELLDRDLDGLGDGEVHELVVELHRQATRLAAACTRAVGVWDARRIWANNGSKAAGARLARETRVAPASANATVRRARTRRAMPHVTAAFAAGDISTDQVDLLRRTNTARVAHQFADHEADLVKHASQLCYSDLERVVRYWQLHADAAGCADEARRQDQDRQAHASRTFAGTVELKASMEPVGGGIFLEELRRLERELFEADWADARQRCGDQATVDDLRRTPAQRRHDALVAMARRSAAMPDGARPARPLISVLVGYETFANTICELGDRTIIPPSSILPLLDEADIERIVFDGPNRVTEVGERTRFFSPAQRRAIAVRDQHCQHPSGCEVPAQDCQADHIIEHTDGGPTTITNGRALCTVHNRQRPGRRRGPPNRGE